MKDCHIEDIVLLPDNMSDFELRKQDLSPEFEEACADESAPSLGEMLENAEEPAQEAARYWMLPESGEEAPAAVAGCRPLLFDRSTDLQQWLVQGYVE